MTRDRPALRRAVSGLAPRPEPAIDALCDMGVVQELDLDSFARDELANRIRDRIEAQLPELQRQWEASAPVRHIVIDDVLPDEFARLVAARFPPVESMMLKSSIRERKHVGVDVDRYAPEVTETLYALQNPRVIEAIGRATGLGDLGGDPSLYAAGLSAMGKGDFLNPHLDNSHDGDIRVYRALNVLYYVSPDWKPENGGNLEIWDPDVKRPKTILSRFNRLVVMETNQTSWHSVSRVLCDAPRYCVSNYYFSLSPPGGVPYRHVTTFTGRPEQPVTRAVLRVVDGLVLNTIGRLFPALVKRNRHRIKEPTRQ